MTNCFPRIQLGKQAGSHLANGLVLWGQDGRHALLPSQSQLFLNSPFLSSFIDLKINWRTSEGEQDTSNQGKTNWERANILRHNGDRLWQTSWVESWGLLMLWPWPLDPPLQPIYTHHPCESWHLHTQRSSQSVTGLLIVMSDIIFTVDVQMQNLMCGKNRIIWRMSFYFYGTNLPLPHRHTPAISVTVLLLCEPL